MSYKRLLPMVVFGLALGACMAIAVNAQEEKVVWVRFTEPTEFAVVRGDSVYFYDVKPRTVFDTVLVLNAPAEGLIIGTKGLGKPIPPIHKWYNPMPGIQYVPNNYIELDDND